MPKINQWSLKYKFCQQCGETSRSHVGNGLCRRCYNKWHKRTPAGIAERKRYNKRYFQTEKGKNKLYNQKLREYGFGGTLNLKLQLIKEQKNKCAICQNILPEGIRQSHFDHDHVKNTPRAILCSRCNLGLGHFMDNPEYLRSAAEYLEKFSSKI